MTVRRRGKVVRAFDPVASLFADIGPCVLLNVALQRAVQERGLAFFKATWFDGRVRWLQVIAIPFERGAETLNAWFGSARDDHEATEDRTLVVCPGPNGERPVIMTAARVHDVAFDSAQHEAEEYMAETLRTLLPTRASEVLS